MTYNQNNRAQKVIAKSLEKTVCGPRSQTCFFSGKSFSNILNTCLNSAPQTKKNTIKTLYVLNKNFISLFFALRRVASNTLAPIKGIVLPFPKGQIPRGSYRRTNPFPQKDLLAMGVFKLVELALPPNASSREFYLN